MRTPAQAKVQAKYEAGTKGKAALAKRATPEGRAAIANYNLKRNGLTAEQFDARLASQGGRCANPGCRTDNPGGKGRFHIDHDHDCCPKGKSCSKCIRGLLCHDCNTGMGLLGDSVERLEGAVAYLKMWALTGGNLGVRYRQITEEVNRQAIIDR